MEIAVREINRNPLCTDEKFLTLLVSYPKSWFAPIKLSPFSFSIENETISWMSNLKLIKNKKTLKQTLDMEPRHYAGYTHSMAAYEHALMYCKYITMWLLWDDDCVEIADDVNQVAPPLLALAGELTNSEENIGYYEAFLHIGNEYERLGASKNWRKRFSEKMLEWAKYAIEEEKIRNNIEHHSFEDALKLRSFTVGIRPNTLPLERAVGIEILDEILIDPEYEELLDNAARICCIVNDIVSVPKDLNNKQIYSNLVLYYKHLNKISLNDSFRALIEIHNHSVLRFDSLANSLLSKVKSTFHERLSTYLYHLRYMDSGFGFWHQDCARYQNLVAVENGIAYRLSIIPKS